MNTEEYLKKLTRQINATNERREIWQEYLDHIEDHKEALMAQGYSEKEAEKTALNQLGDPTDVGRQLNKVHRTGLDWQMTAFFVICAFIVNVVPYIWWGEKGQVSDTPSYILYSIAGLIMLVGFAISFMEKYTDSPLFYAWANNWNGGGISNSGLILAISLFPIHGSIQVKLLGILVISFLLTIQRQLIAHFKDLKEKRLLWKTGIALTDISYKGKGQIDGENLRLKTTDDVIKKGHSFMVIGFDGFKPIVSPL